MDRWIRLPRNRERDNTIIKPQPIRTCQWPRKRCGWECRRSEREWINFIDFPQPLFTTLCGWLDQKLGQELKVPYWEYPPIIVRFNCYPCWLFVGQPMGPSFLPSSGPTIRFGAVVVWSGEMEQHMDYCGHRFYLFIYHGSCCSVLRWWAMDGNNHDSHLNSILIEVPINICR